MNTKFIIALILVLLVVGIVVFYGRKTEPFSVNVRSMELDDIENVTRDEYIEISKNRYNRFADPYDSFRPGFAGNMSNSDIDKLEKDLRNTLRSGDLVPADPKNKDSKTGFLYTALDVRESIPPVSSVMMEARKCEAHKTRDACSILGKKETSRCGVCIKGGTDSRELNPKKHIGGLLILPDDRKMYEEEAKDENRAPLYEPTIGQCPEGFFYVDRDQCEKEVNRLNCKESGESGGFQGGHTIENKFVVKESCAMCPSGDSNFIYEPKGSNKRKFKPRVRVITPTGTGLNRVRAFVGNDNVGEAVGLGGQELLIDFTANVSEADNVRFVINQQFPHRPRGKQEVYNMSNQDIKLNFSMEQAKTMCENSGSRMATKSELNAAYDTGAQLCEYGLAEGFHGMIMQTEFAPKCGKGIGLNSLNGQNSYSAWCYGIKPPVGHYVFDKTKRIKVWDFYLPEDNETPSKKSMHGPEYEAASYRGVIMQWEMKGIDPTARRVGIESTITSVMGMDPTTVTTDGFKMFKVLRRMGTFKASQMIIAPRPASSPNMMTSQYWIWSNQAKNYEFTFTAKVPGILANPRYVEDIVRCPRGPILGEESSLDLLKISPCMKDGQEPGRYSVDCLTSLFRSAGGDPYSGTLSPQMGPDNQRKLMYGNDGKARDQDEILDMLVEITNTVSSGRDKQGELVGGNNKKERRRIINESAQKMFGVDLVTPCEDVQEDSQGNILLIAKSLPLDADCLDHLYTNAGYDKSRGMEGAVSGTLKATYQNIMDRFSGLKNKEKDPEKDKYPFMTCKRSGDNAPIREDGSINISANARVNQRAINSGNSVDAVQQIYNEVFTKANRTFKEDEDISPEKIEEHNKNVKACFGITKNAQNAILPTKCGVMARYVQVLRSTSSRVPRYESYYHIQIPQIQVFDSTGAEIGKGKSATANSIWLNGREGVSAQKAVDGTAAPRAHPNEYHDQNTGDDSKEFWLLDLGNVFEIRKIVYYNRTDCCFERAMHMPIQLLDADKRVVAQKLLSMKAVTDLKETIEFAKEDVMPRIPIGNLVPGSATPIRIETAVETNACMREAGGAIHTEIMSVEMSAQNINRFGFIIRPPLNGRAGAVSFEFIDSPGQYLMHYPGANMRLYINKSDWTPKSASWFIRPALNGAPGWVSLESCHSPGQYAIRWPRDAGISIVERVNPNGPELPKLRACWRISRLQAAPFN